VNKTLINLLNLLEKERQKLYEYIEKFGEESKVTLAQSKKVDKLIMAVMKK
jgi:hypothetical protein